MEVWKDIKGYEGYYQVSNLGRVKSLKRHMKTKKYNQTWQERILKERITHKGYKRINLNRDGKRVSFRVHRLVAQAFIQNPYNKPQINHINEKKEDNRVENLEWVTNQENTDKYWENRRL